MKNAKSTLSLFLLVSAAVFLSQCSESEEILEAAPVNNTTTNTSDAKASGRTGGSPFHEGVGEAIPTETAHSWIRNYVSQNPRAIQSHFFGTRVFNELLNQPGIVGISLQYAINDAGEPQIILIGVDANGKYMLSAPGAATSITGKTALAGSAYDASSPCPNQCASYSLTNSY